MSKKKIQIALVIIVILALSLFWSGTRDIVPLSLEDKDRDLSTTADEDNIYVLDKNTDESYQVLEEIEETEEAEASKEDEILKNQEDEEKASDKEENEHSILQKPEENIKDKDTSSKDKKDKYLTNPIPEGKPNPVESQDIKVEKHKKLTATLSVTCKTILNNMDLFDRDKMEVLPEDGIIYAAKKVELFEGESVFDVLLREMKDNKIHMEFSMTPIYNSNYIEGINNIYEFDCGELSGWIYKVNGWFPNYGVSRYPVENGDNIELIYTCDLGRDINAGSAVNQSDEDE